MEVQLVRPFPARQLPLMWQWTKHSPGLLNEHEMDEAAFLSIMGPILSASLSWAILASGAPIGVVVVQPLIYPGQKLARDGQIHLALARSAWGQGVMQQVGPPILRTCFSSIPTLARLTAHIAGPNRPITALCESLGFRQEGTLRNAVHLRGRDQDINLYGLTRSDANVLWSNTDSHIE